ncbi:hypothetical protein [Marinicella sp. W31]|uniref:hypothetical protein n=1 Tax=Marinicella sp. W31 TaxID=3023713 RepID=UPI0037567007
MIGYFKDIQYQPRIDKKVLQSKLSFSKPPLESLLVTQIPIFFAIGTADENVPIESAYIVTIEFLRHGKNNLTFKQYVGFDHNALMVDESGHSVDRWNQVTDDFFNWLSKN